MIIIIFLLSSTTTVLSGTHTLFLTVSIRQIELTMNQLISAASFPASSAAMPPSSSGVGSNGGVGGDGGGGMSLGAASVTMAAKQAWPGLSSADVARAHRIATAAGIPPERLLATLSKQVGANENGGERGEQFCCFSGSSGSAGCPSCSNHKLNLHPPRQQRVAAVTPAAATQQDAGARPKNPLALQEPAGGERHRRSASR